MADPKAISEPEDKEYFGLGFEESNTISKNTYVDSIDILYQNVENSSIIYLHLVGKCTLTIAETATDNLVIDQSLDSKPFDQWFSYDMGGAVDTVLGNSGLTINGPYQTVLVFKKSKVK